MTLADLLKRYRNGGQFPTYDDLATADDLLAEKFIESRDECARLKKQIEQLHASQEELVKALYQKDEEIKKLKAELESLVVTVNVTGEKPVPARYYSLPTD